VILEIVAIVLVILFSLVMAVLLIPFHVVLAASISQSARKFDVALSWLGLTLWHRKQGEAKRPEEKKKATPAKRKFSIQKGAQILSSLRDSIPALSILVRSIKRALHIQSLDANFVFGSGDPADTAIIAGYLWSFAWILNSVPSVSISFRPDLEMIGIDGSIRAEAKVRMLFLAIGILRAYSKKPFRKLIKEVRTR